MDAEDLADMIEEDEVKYEELTEEQVEVYQLLQSFNMSDESIQFFVGKYSIYYHTLFIKLNIVHKQMLL